MLCRKRFMKKTSKEEDSDKKADLPIELGTCSCCIWEDYKINELPSTYVILALGRHRVPLCKKCFNELYMDMTDLIIKEQGNK